MDDNRFDWDGEEYEMVMPFVVVQTEGGPFDDDSFARGWDCGALDTRLGFLDLLGVLTHQENVATLAIKQADLIAMKHGWKMTHEPSEDEDWQHCLFTKESNVGLG